MRIRRALTPLILVPLIFLATALAGCGGGDEPTSGGSDPGTSSSPEETPADPDVTTCDLLTADEVGDIVGAQVKAGVVSTGPVVTGGTFSSCTWVSDDPDHPADSATVTVYPNADAADSARGADDQPIEGLGDDAFEASFGSVWVYEGDLSFFAQWYAFNGTDEELLPRSKALAEAVLEAL